MRHKIFIVFLSLCFGLIFYSCQKKTQRIPLVTTSANSPGAIDAYVSGVLYTPGDAPVIEQGICYGTEANNSINGNKVVCETGKQNFTAHLTNLTPQTYYYARAYAKNKYGTAYGKEIRFATFSTNLPNLYLYSPSTISTNSVVFTLQATQGGNSTYTIGLCWSKSSMPTANDYTTQIAVQQFSQPPLYNASLFAIITDLDASSKYYARAFCKSVYGETYSNMVSWTTLTPVNPVNFTMNSVAHTTASCYVSISNISVSEVKLTGVCWSESPSPTNETLNQKTEYSGAYMGTLDLTGLKSNTTYYLRAYVVTNTQVIYSASQKMIRTFKGTAMDIDGNIYNTVEINGLEWMASNLRVSKFNDGTSLQFVNYYNQWVNSVNSQVPVYCYYGDNSQYNLIYGKLYPGYVAQHPNIAPTGWRVATVSDWQNLLSVVNTKDLCIGNNYWAQGYNLNNPYNFSLYPAGYWNSGYSSMSYASRLWAVPSGGNSNTIDFSSHNTYSITWMSNGNGHSIRCVR